MCDLDLAYLEVAVISGQLDTWGHVHCRKSGYVSTDPTNPDYLNTVRTKQNGCHLTDNIFKCIFL